MRRDRTRVWKRSGRPVGKTWQSGGWIRSVGVVLVFLMVWGWLKAQGANPLTLATHWVFFGLKQANTVGLKNTSAPLGAGE